MTTTAPHVHLRLGGTSLLARTPSGTLPSIVYWGPDLGEVKDDQLEQTLTATLVPQSDSEIYLPSSVSVLPQHSEGWIGRPGLLGSRAGRSWSVAFDQVVHMVDLAGSAAWPDGPPGALRLQSTGTDLPGALSVSTTIELLPSGLVRLRAGVTNDGEDPYEVSHLEPGLPVPTAARELLDMAGRHTHERTPQRLPFQMGRWTREAWGGRPGHDSATTLCAGEPGFGFRSGHVWGVHLGYSGNQVLAAESSFTGSRLLRGGEILLPAEGVLATGESYETPWLYGSWGDGLDQFAGRFHDYLRTRDQHPRQPRPVLVNTWEAVYFDHELTKLIGLVEKAASLGAERFVLDDGWFLGRRDDRAGLGDWEEDPDLWPAGLTPLVEAVKRHGMDFGLWVEPEMVNLDSDLARKHPEWVFATDHGPGLSSRYQHVLDLGHPAAYEHILERLSTLVARYDIAYLKWDHNRPLVDAGHSPDGRPGVRAHTLAVYRLMAELKGRHPGLEIESCCGGGGRLDLGILEHTDRVWVSDCIDAHERHRMVRWTGLILPPELMGTHIGSGADHTTGRRHPLSFRAGTAMWGHLGIEWDLTEATDAELQELHRWVQLYKELRPLLHSGDVVHADLDDPSLSLEGVVSRDRTEAVYRFSVLDHTLTASPGRVTLPGLDPELTYHAEALSTGDTHRTDTVPPWTTTGTRLPGRILGQVGLQAPLLQVDRLAIWRLRAT